MPDVEVFGVTVSVSNEVPELVLMEFADVADGNTTEMQAKAAMLRLLKEIVAKKDWPKFRSAAIKANADTDALLEVISNAFQANVGHPTGGSADSSAGPEATAPNSTDVSSLPVIRRLEDQRRPDLAAFVAHAGEVRAAS